MSMVLTSPLFSQEVVMSAAKSITVTGPNSSGKLFIKESHFRHDLSKQKTHSVGGSGSLREDFIKALRVADNSDRTSHRTFYLKNRSFSSIFITIHRLTACFIFLPE